MRQTTPTLLMVTTLLASVDAAVAQTPEATFLLCDPEAHPEARLASERAHRESLLASGRFDEVAAALDALRAGGRREGDFATQLDPELERLSSISLLGPLDAWCTAQPECAWPFLLRGRAAIRHAWAARGSGWADAVTEEGSRLFGERLVQARERLERAAELRPDWPEACDFLIIVAKGLSLPSSEAREYFDRAVAADPGYFPAYRDMLDYLAPRWHGSREAMFGFAREVIAAHPDEHALALLMPDAHWSMAPGREAAYVRTPAVLAEVEACVTRALAAYPRSPKALWWRVRLTEEVAPDSAAKIDALSRLSDMGDAKAQRSLGCLLLAGHIRDGHRALELLCRAAHQGEARAQYRLAQCLANGEVVARDDDRATFWLRRAAEGGNADGMVALAWRFQHGTTVERDMPSALSWYRRAADAGSLYAAAELGEILAVGAEAPQDLEESRRWLVRGAERRDSQCLYLLGRFHATTPAEAANLYRRAIQARGRGADASREPLQTLLQAHPELRRAGDP